MPCEIPARTRVVPFVKGGSRASLWPTSPVANTGMRGGARFCAVPWHGWEYDVTTGQSWVDPSSVRTRRYEVEVATADALPSTYQPGPYTAEKFEVSVDQEYIVVELPG